MDNFETKKERSSRIIKSVIKELDMNLTEFASAIGMGYMQVYYVANGTTKTISEDLINAIKSKFPNISTRFLMYGTGNVFGEEDDNAEDPKTIEDVFGHPSTIGNTELVRLMNRVLDYLDKVRTREEELTALHTRLTDLEERLLSKLEDNR